MSSFRRLCCSSAGTLIHSFVNLVFYDKLTLDSFSFSVLCAKNLVKKDFFRKYLHI